jgi:hypothetical protein
MFNELGRLFVKERRVRKEVEQFRKQVHSQISVRLYTVLEQCAVAARARQVRYDKGLGARLVSLYNDMVWRRFEVI